jgi:hypothetical protein
LYIETHDIDAALGDLELEDFEHLLELKLGRRDHRHGRLQQFESCVRSLEIKPLRELAARLIDRVGQFVRVDFRYDVERRHGRSPLINVTLNDTRAPAA